MSMRIVSESKRETQSGWRAVCDLSDIIPNTGVCTLLSGQQVAVFRVGAADTVYAISNFDPFSRANVLSRGIVGDRAGRPKVASPIYKQSFCLESGLCLDDENVQIPVFEARVREGSIEIGGPVTRLLLTGNAGLLSESNGR
jgi:nitrite reductase (NADH) small subunit